MQVNDMDKYELTEAINKAKEILSSPESNFHFNGPNRDEVLAILEEINNPPTDGDGYVHKYYLTDGTKSLIEVLTGDRDP